MLSSALIVIDMQAAFHAANNPKTIASCVRLLQEAVANQRMIMFVEYKWNGRTLPQLLSVVKNYPLTYFVKKMDDDGAYQIQNAFYKCRTYPKNLIVCGVNTDCCVYDTVRSLMESKKFDISVVKDACNTVWLGGDQKLALLKKLGVKVI